MVDWNVGGRHARAVVLLRRVILPPLLPLLLAVLVSGCGSERTPSRPAQSPPAAQAQQDEPEAETKLVDVPDVVGMDAQEAVEAIEAEGARAIHDEEDAAGCVVDEQDPTGEVEPRTEVILTLDCRQREWEDREGSAWQLFVSSFARGAQKGCDVLFSFSPTATLYAGGREYRPSDCRVATDEDPASANVGIPQEAPDEPDALGLSLGLVHGCKALFDAQPIGLLSYGNAGYTAHDCVQALEVRRRPAPQRSPSR